jgi:hypothetical protein
VRAWPCAHTDGLGITRGNRVLSADDADDESQSRVNQPRAVSEDGFAALALVFFRLRELKSLCHFHLSLAA